MPSHLTLILGGARSGKSIHAERLAAAENRPVHFLPTFNPALCPEDSSMAERVNVHRSRRPDSWITHEPAHANLIETIQRLGNSLILIDCMTLWLSGILAAQPNQPSLKSTHSAPRSSKAPPTSSASPTNSDSPPSLPIPSPVTSAISTAS